jgi:hypothetical protein
MTIEQAGTVDFIGTDITNNEVILTITDHLRWSVDSKNHLRLLQNKINTYLAFIESGELLQTYSDAAGRTVVILIVGQYSLNVDAENFIAQVKPVLIDAGMSLRFDKLQAG